MLASCNKIPELSGVDPRALPDDVLLSTRPVVLKGLVANWPIVRAGLESSQAASAYIRRFYRDATVGALLGAPDIEGRFFYNHDLSGFNFRAVKLKLDVMLDEVARHEHEPKPPAIYVGSTTIDTCLPGFRAENDLAFGARNPLASIWLGNRTRIAAHHDLPDNLACVAVGLVDGHHLDLVQLHVAPLEQVDEAPRGGHDDAGAVVDGVGEVVASLVVVAGSVAQPAFGVRDELTDLADTFNALLERLQESFERERRFRAVMHPLDGPKRERLYVTLLHLALPEGNPLHVSAYTVTLLGKYLCYALLAVAVVLLAAACSGDDGGLGGAAGAVAPCSASSRDLFGGASPG